MSSKSQDALGTVVVGVSGSAGASSAMRWTAAFAKATSADVVAVHVLTYNREFVRDLSLDTIRTWRTELRDEFENVWIEPLRSAGVDFRPVLTEADSAAIGILQVADAVNAGLIAVGTQHRAKIVGRVLGAVAYGVSHHPNRPVVVVPAEWNGVGRSR